MVYEPDDDPHVFHERRARLYLCEFCGGGPLDGMVEVREGDLPRTLVRRWFPMTRGPGPRTEYSYGLLEPIEGAHVEYFLLDAQPEGDL